VLFEQVPEVIIIPTGVRDEDQARDEHL